VCAQHGEHNTDVSEVLGPCLAVYQNIVKKDENELAKKRAKNLVHQSLKCRGCVGEAERHDHELEVAVVRVERRLVDVLRVHAHLMLAAAEVQLGEERRALEFIEQFVHNRDWEQVADGLGVQCAVVDAEPPGAVLADKEDRR